MSGNVALVSAGAGYAAGLSLDYLTGVGLLGALGRDNRVDNYDFASDFDSRLKAYVPGGIRGVDGLKESFDAALKEFAQSVGWSTDKESQAIHVSDASTLSFINVYSGVGDSEGTRSSLVFVLNCLPDSDVCWGSYRLKQGAGAGVLVTRLLTLFSEQAPETVFYLPPNREIYQLPAILQNGEMKYLVEQ